MFRFRMDIAGEIQFDRGISRFADGVTDYKPVWPVIEDDWYAEEKEQFQSEGAAGGQRWKLLSPDYLLWKMVHYPNAERILERTGNLERSLTKAGDPNGVCLEARKTLTLGTKIPYAIYHQSIEPRTIMPRRPVIQLTESFKRGVMRQIQMYLVTMASECGFRQGWAPGTLESLWATRKRGKSVSAFHGIGVLQRVG